MTYTYCGAPSLQGRIETFTERVYSGRQVNLSSKLVETSQDNRCHHCAVPSQACLPQPIAAARHTSLLDWHPLSYSYEHIYSPIRRPRLASFHAYGFVHRAFGWRKFRTYVTYVFAKRLPMSGVYLNFLSTWSIA